MIKYFKKKIVFLLVVLVFTICTSFFGYGFFEYNEWLEIKTAISAGGYPWQCGGTFTMIQPGCTRSCLGKCCCALCDAVCDGSTQAIFVGQPMCGVNFMCVAPTQLVNGTPIQAASGKQFIAGNTTSSLFMGNGTLATPSMAASQFQKFVDAYDYIIAGIKRE